MALLEIEDLRCYFKTESGVVRAVNGVSFSIDAGETVGLVGESGCGKTTLALSVMGLLPSSATVSGSIRFRGIEINNLSEAEKDRLRWRHIALAFQNSAEVLNPVLTVGEQIMEPLRKHLLLSCRDAEKRCFELLKMVGLGVEWSSRYPHQLSGGMRQRVLLAMALACEPDLVIIDEPTTGLDPIARSEILQLLADLRRRHNLSLVLISHDLAVISTLASRVMVMYAGRVVEEGLTREVLTFPCHPYTRGLINSTPALFPYKDLWGIPGETPGIRVPAGCAFHPRCTQALEECRRTVPELRTTTDGRRVACHRGGIVALLKAKGISHEYPLGGRRRLKVLDGIDLEIREGETVALVGKTGSGKSTLAHILAGVVRPTAGEVYFQGVRVQGSNMSTKLGGVQIVFQDPFSALSHRFKVLEAVREPLDINRIGSLEERNQRVKEVLASVQLPSDENFLNRYCCELSGGQRQRLALARALVMEPKLLIADEITSALDVSTQANILRLLKGLQNSYGFAMLYITHDITLALKIAERLMILQDGALQEKKDFYHAVTEQVFAENEWLSKFLWGCLEKEAERSLSV